MTPAPVIRYRYLPTEQVVVGEAAASALARAVDETASKRVLILASRSLNQSTNEIAAIATALGERCLGVFDEIRAHTPRPDVLKAITTARDTDADCLIAVGGGSVIDACKVVQLAINTESFSEADLISFAQGSDGSRGPRAGAYREHIKQRPGNKPLRFIAVPTTLSGAEFSTTAGVLDTVKNAKEGYRGDDLCAKTIIYDPALCRHTPQWLWLSTAIRALDHAIEGYCALDSHPFLQGQFLHAMRLFASALPRLRADPDDVQARALSQQATWLACCGLGRVSHGASHGIGYSLGALCDVPHGYTSCVMLPAVLAWNSQSEQLALGTAQAAIAEALGWPGLSAAEALTELLTSLELPRRLRDLRVARSQLPAIAAQAARHPVVRKNPRPISSADDVMQILTLAW